jgi:hypothetical protein
MNGNSYLVAGQEHESSGIANIKSRYHETIVARKTDTVPQIDLEFIENGGIITSNAEELEELKNESGNQLYKTKKYHQKIPLYMEAIELCLDSSAYYGNLSAC